MQDDPRLAACAAQVDEMRETIKQLTGVKHIVIIGRRWFQKSYGNTYHSVTVIVDGETIGRVDFAYGYGDQYIQSAFDVLQKAGYYEGKTYSDFCQDRMDHRDRFTITVSDVARQKDLY